MNAIGAYFSPSGGTKRACELVGGLFDAKEYVNLGGRTRESGQVRQLFEQPVQFDLIR